MRKCDRYVKCASFCKALSVGVLMRYKPGEVVYDWGAGTDSAMFVSANACYTNAGCGHALGWLRRAFGVSTAGHEYHKQVQL